MLRLFYLQDYLYSPITQLFLKYFNDLCHKTYFNRNFGAVALWSYKNKHFKSLCVVSNEHGGFIYDPIGSNILEYTTTTTTNTVERLNSKENLH